MKNLKKQTKFKIELFEVAKLNNLSNVYGGVQSNDTSKPPYEDTLVNTTNTQTNTVTNYTINPISITTKPKR
jgi:hypothetical protein